MGEKKAEGELPLYARVSTSQKGIVEALSTHFWETLPRVQRRPRAVHVDGCALVRVADLGCATGANTLTSTRRALSHVLPWLLHQHPDHHNDTSTQQYTRLEVQLFFNDLPSNDFNSLFRTLLQHELFRDGASCLHMPSEGLDDGGDDNDHALIPRNNMVITIQDPRVFAAGVPGSFYHRLFPTSSIHLFTSFIALHWLSKVPDEILDPSSPSFNRGRISCKGASTATQEAYVRQQRHDLSQFFINRSEELVPGGLLLLIALAKPDLDDKQCENDNALLATMQALVAEGLIQEETIDSFNVTYCYIREEEIRRVIEENGSFEIHYLQRSPIMCTYSEEMMKKFSCDRKYFATLQSKSLESVFGSRVHTLLGPNLYTKFFSKLQQVMEEITMSTPNVLDFPLTHERYIVTLLSRK